MTYLEEMHEAHRERLTRIDLAGRQFKALQQEADQAREEKRAREADQRKIDAAAAAQERLDRQRAVKMARAGDRRRVLYERIEAAMKHINLGGKTMKEIALEVSEKHGVGLLDICSARKSTNIVRARDEAMCRCRDETPHSLPQIGKFFGGRDHTTVMVAVRRQRARSVGEKYSRCRRPKP